MTDEQLRELEEQRRDLHGELDRLGAAITSRLRHMEEHGLFDPEAGKAADEFDVQHVSAQTSRGRTEAESGRGPTKSAIQREVDALGHRFKMWLAHVDRDHARALHRPTTHPQGRRY
jgi:hypothetical protein